MCFSGQPAASKNTQFYAAKTVTVDLSADELRDTIAALDDLVGRKDRRLRKLRFRLACLLKKMKESDD